MDDLKWLREREDHILEISLLREEKAKLKERLTEAEGWLRQFNTCLSLQDTTKLLRAVHKFLSRGCK